MITSNHFNMLLEKPCFQSRIFLQNHPSPPPLLLHCMQGVCSPCPSHLTLHGNIAHEALTKDGAESVGRGAAHGRRLGRG
jgi:predicted protein tyrosine phosphatase